MTGEKLNLNAECNANKQMNETFCAFDLPDDYYIGYFDGASRGNPGLAGAGAWISDANNLNIWENSISLGKKTNNEAEYLALIDLLRELYKRGIKRAEIRGDSKLVIEQMSNRWKVREPRLIELCRQAKLLSAEMFIKYQWIPREQNTLADSLSNKAIDNNDNLL